MMLDDKPKLKHYESAIKHIKKLINNMIRKILPHSHHSTRVYYMCTRSVDFFGFNLYIFLTKFLNSRKSFT